MAITDISGWNDLPAHLIEDVLRDLLRSTSDKDASRSDLFAACGTCTFWRKLGLEKLFKQPWDACPAIVHPLQLFSLSPQAVEGGLLQCHVTRERLRGRMLGTTRFCLYLGPGGASTDQSPTPKFLVAALQGFPFRSLTSPGGGGATTALYLNRACSGEPVARLGSNWSSNRYNLAPTQHCVASQATRAARFDRQAAVMTGDLPQTLATVEYNKRAQGFMRPRRISIELPNPADLACFENKASAATQLGQAMCAEGAKVIRNSPSRTSFRKIATSGWGRSMSFFQSMQHRTRTVAGDMMSTTSSFTDLTQLDSDGSPVLESPPRRRALMLKNKLPQWNAGLRCWCLNFRSRVKLPSVKNFQLQCCDLDMADALAAAAAPAPGISPAAQMTPERRLRQVVMQFGKASDDTFIMDYNPTVLTAVQSFGIALSTFDGKLRI